MGIRGDWRRAHRSRVNDTPGPEGLTRRQTVANSGKSIGLPPLAVGGRGQFPHGCEVRCLTIALCCLRLSAQTTEAAGMAEFQQGRYAVAERLLRQELTSLEAAVGPQGAALAPALNNLATVYCRQRLYSKAIPLYERSLRILTETVGTEHAETAAVWNNLGELYGSLGDFRAAETLHRRALAIRERVIGAESPETALSMHNLGAACRRLGRDVEAETLLLRSVAVWERTVDDPYSHHGASLAHLAILYAARREWEKADSYYRRSTAILQVLLGSDHPDVGVVMWGHSRVLARMGRSKEAKPLAARAKAILQNAGLNQASTIDVKELR